MFRYKEEIIHLSMLSPKEGKGGGGGGGQEWGGVTPRKKLSNFFPGGGDSDQLLVLIFAPIQSSLSLEIWNTPPSLGL